MFCDYFNWRPCFPPSASTKAVVEESSRLAECVGKTRGLLKKILSEGVDGRLTQLDNDPQGYLSQPLALLESVLQECHNTFTVCFHAFYPTPALQWACLCDLLNCLDQVGTLCPDAGAGFGDAGGGCRYEAPNLTGNERRAASCLWAQFRP